jgi:PKD repeat protein
MRRFGSPGGTVVAKLYAGSGTFGSNDVPTGSPLATSATQNLSAISTAANTFVTFTFSGANRYLMSPGQTYVLTVEYTGGDSSNNFGVLVAAAGTSAGNLSVNDGTSTAGYGAFDAVMSAFGTLSSPPVASFTAIPTSGNASLLVTFTDTSTNTPTSWLWDFGDSNTSTSQNPTHSYGAGRYQVTLTATNADGSNTSSVTVIDALRPLVLASPVNNPASPSAGGTVTLGAAPSPPATDWSALGKEDEKRFLYKVSDSAGNYIGIWPDVIDDPMWTQQINSPGTTTAVRLSRSANNRLQSFLSLIAQDSSPLITQAGDQLVVTADQANTVGTGSDVDLNYQVDIYVAYGGWSYLPTQDGNQLVVTYGAPLGVRVFSGFILDYTSRYAADREEVVVTLASNGWELSNEPIRSGATTTLTYSASPIETQVKSILDTNPGKLSYSAISIANTGINVDGKFQLNTKLEGIESLFTQTTTGWYWYANPADNLLYLKPASVLADHIFILGKHIESLDLKRSIEGLVNDFYFVGGDTTPGDDTTMVFKHLTDSGSITSWRRGLQRVTDRRYTLSTSITNYWNRIDGDYGQPAYTTTIVISAGRYDVETIKLGQMVGFGNFGNFIDGILLQIVSLSYTPYKVTLQLGKPLQRQIDIIDDVDQSLSNEQYGAVPTAPS